MTPHDGSPQTGRQPAPTGSGEFVLNVASHTFVTRLPSIDRDGIPFVEHELGKQFERAVAMKLAELGDTSAPAFRFMRKAMGLRITDLAELFDTSPEIIKAWESGDQPVGRTAWALLAALIADALAGRAKVIGMLKATQMPRSVPEELRVELG